MTDVDDKLMARAIEIAQQGDPSPNPPVGSIVADGETIVAEGFHQAAGMDHAEIAALKEEIRTLKKFEVSQGESMGARGGAGSDGRARGSDVELYAHSRQHR